MGCLSETKEKRGLKKIDWDEYYARKIDDDFSLSEKHFLYYLAFKQLGFFDNLNKSQERAGFRNIKYCILQAPDDFPLIK